MQRAAILIGVSTTGGLPALQAVDSGLARMREWVGSQGIREEDGRLAVFSDAGGGKVRAYEVAEAIGEMVKKRDLDQLLVYFTGHGVHNRGDIWLLSGAPTLSSEAVNVEGSIQAARGCGVSHVVLVSDACRTAAEGIAGLEVKGIDIFPNEPVDGLERPVDSYFACARGKPALEIRDPLEAARGFSGVYTEVLAECLTGRHPGVLDVAAEEGVTVGHVGAWKLADYLVGEVPRRLKEKLRKTPTLNQTPVGRITSRDAWVSLVKPYVPHEADAQVEVLGADQPDGLNAVEAADRLLADVLGGQAWRGGGLLGEHDPDLSGGVQLSTMAAQLARPLRPVTVAPAPTRPCSTFRLRGEQASALHVAPGAGAVFALPMQAGLGVEGVTAPADGVLALANGRCVLLPVIPDWETELHVQSDELVHLAFRTADGAPAAAGTAPSGDRLLLAAVAAASGMGVLRLTDGHVEALTAALERARRLDPALALYLAYAFHDRGERPRIATLHARLLHEYGITLFDVAMLAGGGHLAEAQRAGTVFPPAPALSRGWALLEALHARLPAAMQAMEAYLRPSVWTLFGGAAQGRLIDMIRQQR